MTTIASVTATTNNGTTTTKPAKDTKDKPKSVITLKCELFHEFINAVEAHLTHAQVCHAHGNTDRAKDAERTATVALLALSSEIEQLLSDLSSRSDSLAERLTGTVFDGAHAASDEATEDTDAALSRATDDTFGEDILALDAGD